MSNDTIQTASQLTPISQTFSDSLSSTDLNDYFQINLTSRSKLALIVSDIATDVQLQLLDFSGSVLRISNNQGRAAELISQTLEPGTYYIRVYLDSPATTDYTLSLILQPTAQTQTIWRNYSTGENLLNNTTPIPSAPTDWLIAGVGDFNQDGKPDILWRNYINGQGGFWFMDGSNVIGTAYIPTVSTEWEIAGVGDFNQDGKPDILWRNYVNGQNGVWFMDGTNIASTTLILSVTTDWRIGGVADFNQDGKPDIFWHNSIDGQSGIWLMNGTNLSGTIGTPSVAPTARVQGIEDFNQDGHPDILWRFSNGSSPIWLMQAGNFVGTSSLAAPSNIWISPFKVEDFTPIDIAGNTIANAFNIGTLDGTASYSGSNTNSEDYYRFNLGDGYSLSYSLTGSTSNSLQLLDSAGNIVINSSNLAAGTYYIRVNGNGSYTLNLNAIAAPTIVSINSNTYLITEGDTNADTFIISRTGSTATALIVNYSISGTATLGQDYTIPIGSLIIPAGQSSISIPIATLDDSLVEGDETITIIIGTGNYIIGNATATITIADNDQNPTPPSGDAGNTLETAKDLGTVLPSSTTQTDWVGDSDKKDYYRIWMPIAGRLRVTLTGLTADLDIELLDATGRLIDFSDNSGIQSEEINRFIPVGTYYLFVYPYGNVQSGYTLNVWRT